MCMPPAIGIACLYLKYMLLCSCCQLSWVTRRETCKVVWKAMVSQQAVVTVCESMCVCTGMVRECHNSFCTYQECSRCRQEACCDPLCLQQRQVGMHGKDLWLQYMLRNLERIMEKWEKGKRWNVLHNLEMCNVLITSFQSCFSKSQRKTYGIKRRLKKMMLSEQQK